MSFRGRRRLYNIISAITIFLIIVMSFFLLVSLIFNIVYIKTYVRGYSMLPTLNSSVTDSSKNGDTVFINKYSKISNNDIVVAKVSWWDSDTIIKRLVGIPGDKIEIRDLGLEYGLYVNESLIYTREKNENTKQHFIDYINYITNNNTGYTESGNKCILLAEDEYFLMGDNWEGSIDCLKNGPVKSKNIIGRVELVIRYDVENSFPIVLKYMLTNIFTK